MASPFQLEHVNHVKLLPSRSEGAEVRHTLSQVIVILPQNHSIEPGKFTECYEKPSGMFHRYLIRQDQNPLLLIKLRTPGPRRSAALALTALAWSDTPPRFARQLPLPESRAAFQNGGGS
ncbi:hypothetical protein MRX96_027389 [Rhipicephalus microplus]